MDRIQGKKKRLKPNESFRLSEFHRTEEVKKRAQEAGASTYRFERWSKERLKQLPYLWGFRNEEKQAVKLGQ